jgi:hypothetical protein
MSWEVIMDDEFEVWINALEREERIRILGHVGLLGEHGPNLGRPYVDTVNGSKLRNLKELRVQIGGEPWRVLFAFDPQRNAVLLVGGNKAGDKRWYKTNIPVAEERFERHLARSAT